MKKNEKTTVGVEKNIKNAEKVNTHFSHDAMLALFKTCGVMPKYDTDVYVGACGVVKKVNCFSVNFKKTQSNIYLSDECFVILKKLAKQLKNTEFFESGNAADKIRPNKIICTSQNDVQLMLNELLNQNAVVGVV